MPDHYPVSLAVDLTHVIGRVDPRLYGANLEHIGRSIYGGVWAELLRDRKFAGHDRMYLGHSEGLRHQHPSYGIVTPWTAYQPDFERVLYVHDHTTVYTGQQSQRITIRQPDGVDHGIEQGDLTLQAARAYDCRLVIKGEGQPVTVSLGGQNWTIPAAPADWTPVTHRFTADRDQVTALRIAIQTGSLWIGCASLLPADAIDGFRADVVAALRELAPTFLRWPGGNFVSGYAWQAAIGDRDRRPAYLDPAWGLWEPNDVGTDEFMRLCTLIGAEPVLTINMGNGTPADAAAWVEYCNGSADTPFGRLRAAHGQPAPYGVRTWFIGNEQFGNWQVGHCDAETYARRYHQYRDALRAVDADLFCIGVGVPADLYGAWNELVLAGAGAAMDALSVHYYSIRTERWETPPPAETLYWPKVAAAHEAAAMLDQTLAIAAAHSDPPVPLAFDEWNTYVAGKAPDFFEDYAIPDALYTGAIMNACLKRADRIVLSAIYHLINVMGNVRVTPNRIWVTPSALVLALLTRQRGSVSVGAAVDAPTRDVPGAGNLPDQTAVPLVDAAATFDPDTRRLYVSLVNRDPERSARLTISGIDRAGAADVYIVAGDDPHALNTEAAPTAVRVESAVWAAADATVDLRPHSVTVIALTV